MTRTIIVRNTCADAKIEDRYRPILRDAIAVYRRLFPADLLEVRLLGSVARGNARISHSDIDLAAILRHSPSDETRETMKTLTAQLSSRYPVVTKVDLGTETVGYIEGIRVFVLKTDSLSLYGTDGYPERVVRMQATTLATLVTPPTKDIIRSYGEAIREATDDDTLRWYARMTGKDLLKCFRKFLILRHGVYGKAIVEIHRELARHFPTDRDIFDTLLVHYLHPTTDRSAVAGTLAHAAARWDRMERRYK